MSRNETPVFTLTPSDMNSNHIKTLDALLREYLDDKGMSHLRWYGEALKRIEKVVNPLLKEIKKRDKRLNFELMTPQSHFRVIRHNVFEVFVVFKKVDASKVSLVELDSPTGSGFVVLKQAKFQQSWAELVQGGANQGYFISASLLREYINSFLQNISKEKGILEESVWYDCTNNETDGLLLSISYEGEQYFVHLTPSIYLHGVWPNCGAMWKKVMFRWPDDAVRKKIVDEGIHLACKPVKTSLQHSAMFWQIRFLNGEKLLLQTFKSGCRNKCLQILKTLLESTLSYPCGITPYHLETVTLHLNSLISSPSLWQDSCLGARFLDVVSALQRSFAQESCSHFFAPAIQLYSDIPSSTLKTLSKRLKHIVDSPETFFQTYSRGTVTTQF